jgi:thiamine-monophosphate kinase
VTQRGLTEARALAVLRSELPDLARGVRLGIGDDAAVLRRPKHDQVWTIDACVEGAHFHRTWLSAEDLAHKSLHAAVSDVAAMGAKPIAALVQLTLAPWLTATFLRRFAREQASIARELRCPIVGGNLTAGERLEIVTTALGQVPGRTLLRQGARVGDELWLVGPVGQARLGLLALEAGFARRRPFAPYVLAFRRPQALLGEGLRLASVAHACLDVSDGLRRDAPRLAGQSGVRVVIERVRLERLVTSPFGSAAQALGQDPVATMLQGGEDYALLAAGPPGRRPRFARVIGRIERGEGAWLEANRGLEPLTGGFQHHAG